MFFNKNRQKSCSLIEALDEPAYIFTRSGAPLACNARAKELMRRGSLPFHEALDLAHFTEIVDSMLPHGGRAKELMLGSVLYEYDRRTFPEGTLIRFRSLKERDHILRLSASLDNMPWGIVTIDMTASGRVVYANQGACDLMGMYEGGPIGQSAGDLLRVFGISDGLDSHLKGAEVSYYDFEKRMGEETVWFRLHFIPYHQGRYYCLIVLEDTTEAKQREGQYFQSQRLEALGQLAGGVAHDFNNILSIIDGYARIGRKSAQENPATENCLERITQAVERASAITSQLLTFGRHKIEKGEVNDLGRIIEDQEPLLRPVLDASINLIIKAEEGLLVEAAPDPICQILINLCINSRDAMPDGGDLIIESGRRGEDVFLRVIDTGCGMTQEVKTKMFDPFFTTKDQGKGTGLGLSMVYGIVKDLHGEIDVLTQPGAGTSITIWLPAAQGGETVAEKTLSLQPGEDSLKGYTVLVVEDEKDLLAILEEMLADLGLTVLSAPNGNAALEIQKNYKGSIHFLLTDVVMPELNGVKLSKLFAQARPETKIVFMSGYPSGGQMARVSLPRNAILLPKPVKIDTLSSILCRMSRQGQNEDLESFKVKTGHWRSA